MSTAEDDAKTESVLKDMSKCTICQEDYKTPKSLPCLHTFCLDCLKRVTTVMSQFGELLPCPLCRTLYRIPADEIRQLPTNFYVTEIMGLRKKNRSAAAAATERLDVNQSTVNETGSWSRFGSSAWVVAILVVALIVNVSPSILSLSSSGTSEQRQRSAILNATRALTELDHELANQMKLLVDRLTTEGASRSTRNRLGTLATNTTRAVSRLKGIFTSINDYKPEIQLVHQFPASGPISGGTVLDNRLYVALSKSDSVQVYAANDASYLYQIKVPGLREASDITSCRWNRVLYIADRVSRLLHVVEKPDAYEPRFSSWNVGCRPTGLSVNAEFHIVVSCGSDGHFSEFTGRGNLVHTWPMMTHDRLDTHDLSVDDPDIPQPPSDTLYHVVEVEQKRYVGISNSSCVVGVPTPGNMVYRVLMSCPVLTALDLTRPQNPRVVSRSRDVSRLFPENVALVDGLISLTEDGGSSLVFLRGDLTFVAQVELPVRGVQRLWYDDVSRRLYGSDRKGRVNVFAL